MENLVIVLIASGLSIAAFIWANRWTNIQKTQLLGEDAMIKISDYIKEGTISFLKRQYSTAAKIMLFFFIVLIVLAYNGFVSWYTPFAVISGAFFSALSAYFGMIAATKANVICASHTISGIRKAFKAGIIGASVMGFAVCGFGLFDLGLWYALIYFTNQTLSEAEMMHIITATVITFSFGASFMAFMARVAGGIYTKSADCAADIVGKGELEMDEDDPRNPAVIADNVGDNASDVAGMGQDLNESYVGGNAAAMEAGFQSFTSFSVYFGVAISVSLLVMVPLSISAIGIVASIIGLLSIRAKSSDLKDLLNAVRKGVYVSSLIIAIGSALVIYYSFGNFNYFYAVIIGLITGNLISFISEYFTSATFKPVRELAKKASGGHSSVIIEGIAIGKESALFTCLALVIGMLSAYYVSGHGNYDLGIYGVSLAAVAMLSTLPITLTIDAFGPIADNAQGLLEMSGVKGERLKIANSLDSLGNTTAATGKGYAIGSAAFAAIALINALWNTISASMLKINLSADIINLKITNIWVLAGLMLGVSVPFLFSAKLLRAVGNTTLVMIEEIKRQVRELGIMENKNPPDYQKCIDISVSAAQKYSLIPALLVIIIPLTVFIFGGPEMIIPFLIGSLSSGLSLAVFMSNAGGAWDNAKKLIESGFGGGKNSSSHKAAITGDMVGDPFKDTAGPSLNILIKLMVTLSILISQFAVYLHYIILK